MAKYSYAWSAINNILKNKNGLQKSKSPFKDYAAITSEHFIAEYMSKISKKQYVLMLSPKNSKGHSYNWILAKAGFESWMDRNRKRFEQGKTTKFDAKVQQDELLEIIKDFVEENKNNPKGAGVEIATGASKPTKRKTVTTNKSLGYLDKIIKSSADGVTKTYVSELAFIASEITGGIFVKNDKSWTYFENWYNEKYGDKITTYKDFREKATEFYNSNGKLTKQTATSKFELVAIRNTFDSSRNIKITKVTDIENILKASKNLYKLPDYIAYLASEMTGKNLEKIDAEAGHNFLNFCKMQRIRLVGKNATNVTKQIIKYLKPIKSGKPISKFRLKLGKKIDKTGGTETLVAMYTAAYIRNRNKKFEYFSPEVLKKYSRNVRTNVTVDQALSFDSTWKNSAYECAKALVGKGYVKSTSMVFTREDINVNNLNKIAFEFWKEKYRYKGNELNKAKKDRWNPADIWFYDLRLMRDLLHSTDINELNGKLLKHFKERKIVPVSLKKLPKSRNYAKLVDYNMKPINYDHKIEYVKTAVAGTTGLYENSQVYIGEKNQKYGGKLEIAIDGKSEGEFGIKLFVNDSGGAGGSAGYDLAKAALRKINVKLPAPAVIKQFAKDLKGDVRSFESQQFLKFMLKHSEKNFTMDQAIAETMASDDTKFKRTVSSVYITRFILENKQKNEIFNKFITFAESKTEFSGAFVKAY